MRDRLNPLLYGIMLVLGLFFFFSTTAQAQETRSDIALVAHPAVPIDNLSFDEARQILLGNRQYWDNTLRITLLVRAPVSRERDILLSRIYQMSESRFRQYWISKVFRAKVTSGPKVVFSNDMALELLILIPGSISFVEAELVPKGLKTIRIDGRLPGEVGYALQ